MYLHIGHWRYYLWLNFLEYCSVSEGKLRVRKKHCLICLKSKRLVTDEIWQNELALVHSTSTFYLVKVQNYHTSSLDHRQLQIKQLILNTPPTLVELSYRTVKSARGFKKQMLLFVFVFVALYMHPRLGCTFHFYINSVCKNTVIFVYSNINTPCLIQNNSLCTFILCSICGIKLEGSLWFTL